MKSELTTTSSVNQLPLEILYSIFYHLDVPDIVRARRVSRYLNRVSHSRIVWNDAYRKAEFVRPPGPFLWQTAQDLERALVPSFRVDRNLRFGDGPSPTQKQAIKLKEIRFPGKEIRVDLIFGRFLLIAFREEIRCHDLNLDAFDSNSGASIVYRPTDGTLESFHCVSAIDVEGRPFACAVLNESAQRTRKISIYSLNVGEQSEMTMDLLHQFERNAFDIRSVKLGPRAIVIQGEVFRYPNGEPDEWLVFAMDVHTCKQFLFPSFTHAAWEAAEVPVFTATNAIISRTSISTSTHILLALSFCTQAAGWCTFFLAFTLPPLDIDRHYTSPSTLLRCSHRGIIPGIIIGEDETVLLHDVILNQNTQEVLIGIRVHLWRSDDTFSHHGIVCLSTPPASYDDPQVGTITFQRPGRPQDTFLSSTFLHSSFNGLGRVFYMIQESGYRTVSAIEYDLRVHADSANDDERRHAAKVSEYPSILRFTGPRKLLDYDPYIGRICFRLSVAKYGVIEVLDLAV